MSDTSKWLCLPIGRGDPTVFKDGVISSLLTLTQLPFVDPDTDLGPVEMAAVHNVMELLKLVHDSQVQELPGKSGTGSITLPASL